MKTRTFYTLLISLLFMSTTYSCGPTRQVSQSTGERRAVHSKMEVSPGDTVCDAHHDAESQGELSFRLLKHLYQGENFVCSPMSLTYALAMAAEGASGQTREEMIRLIGDLSSGEVLPAQTDNARVKFQLANALLVNQDFSLQNSYQKTVKDRFHATVESMDFSHPDSVANHINAWSQEHTHGMIEKMLDPKDIAPAAVAYLLNALYFQGEWAGSAHKPMFLSDNTQTEDFHLSDGTIRPVDMMYNVQYHRYAEMPGYKVLALPYAGNQFFFYVFLPDENNVDGLLEELQTTSWSSILEQFKTDAQVYVRLPKFEVENRFDVSETLVKMGVEKAFQPDMAEFDRMFVPKDDYSFCISKVIQGAKIAVTEKGTEAGAVTIVEMMATSAFHPEEPKRVYFYADRPFLFFLGDLHGNVLFQGAFVGEK